MTQQALDQATKGVEMLTDPAESKARADDIITNRRPPTDLADVAEKVCTRDLFGVD